MITTSSGERYDSLEHFIGDSPSSYIDDGEEQTAMNDNGPPIKMELPITGLEKPPKPANDNDSRKPLGAFDLEEGDKPFPNFTPQSVEFLTRTQQIHSRPDALDDVEPSTNIMFGKDPNDMTQADRTKRRNDERDRSDELVIDAFTPKVPMDSELWQGIEKTTDQSVVRSRERLERKKARSRN